MCIALFLISAFAAIFSSPASRIKKGHISEFTFQKHSVRGIRWCDIFIDVDV